jgi:predicted AAA+ superfamily ATPase
MNIPRITQQQIVSKLGAQKVLMLYGTRRTGKTTIIENIVSKYPKQTLLLQGEDMQVSEILQRRTIANYTQLIGTKKIVIIDEAQTIPEIGKVLKLMIEVVVVSTWFTLQANHWLDGTLFINCIQLPK